MSHGPFLFLFQSNVVESGTGVPRSKTLAHMHLPLRMSNTAAFGASAELQLRNLRANRLFAIHHLRGATDQLEVKVARQSFVGHEL